MQQRAFCPRRNLHPHLNGGAAVVNRPMRGHSLLTQRTLTAHRRDSTRTSVMRRRQVGTIGSVIQEGALDLVWIWAMALFGILHTISKHGRTTSRNGRQHVMLGMTSADGGARASGCPTTDEAMDFPIDLRNTEALRRTTSSHISTHLAVTISAIWTAGATRCQMQGPLQGTYAQILADGAVAMRARGRVMLMTEAILRRRAGGGALLLELTLKSLPPSRFEYCHSLISTALS